MVHTSSTHGPHIKSTSRAISQYIHCWEYFQWVKSYTYLKFHAMRVSHLWLSASYIYIYTSLEISTVKFFRKKLVRFSYTPYKYLSYCFITLENIQKVDCAISNRPHSSALLTSVTRKKNSSVRSDCRRPKSQKIISSISEESSGDAPTPWEILGSLIFLNWFKCLSKLEFGIIKTQFFLVVFPLY